MSKSFKRSKTSTLHSSIAYLPHRDRHFQFDIRAILTLIFLISFLCLTSTLKAEATTTNSNYVMVLSDEIKVKDLKEHIFYLEDASQQLTVEQVRNADWIPPSGELNIMGFSQSHFWFKLQLQNNSSPNTTWVTQLHAPYLGQVYQYIYVNDKLETERNFAPEIGFHERPLENRHFIDFVEFAPDDKIEIIYRISAKRLVSFPFRIWQADHFQDSETWNLAFNSLFIGIALCMAIYNFVIWFVVREKSYFYYTLFNLSTATFILHLSGFGYQFIWPESPYWHIRGLYFCAALHHIFACLFAIHFLKLQEASATLTRIFRVLIAVACFYGLTSALGLHELTANIAKGCALIVYPLLVIAGFVSWRNGSKYAIYYLIAWGFGIVCVIYLILSLYLIVPYNVFAEHGATAGAGLEMLLLSLALMAKIKELQQKHDAVKQASTLVERERIMRDLHDDVGGKLVVLIHRLKDKDQELARDTLKALKESIFALDDSAEMPLIYVLNAIEAETRSILQQFEINFQWLEKDKISASHLCSPRERVNLTKIIREAITNALKHAQPKQITVCINLNDNEAVITVENDGVVANPQEWHNGRGTNNMRVRAQDINGELSFQYRSADGEEKSRLIVELIVPLDNSPSERSSMTPINQQSWF